jgi:hypothetical protein
VGATVKVLFKIDTQTGRSWKFIQKQNDGSGNYWEPVPETPYSFSQFRHLTDMGYEATFHPAKDDVQIKSIRDTDKLR